jgi:hypothetical protein
MLQPKTEDMEVFDNGILYVRSHFVTVPLTFKHFDELEFISKSFNAINVHKIQGLFNAMFSCAEDAKAFAKKVNES